MNVKIPGWWQKGCQRILGHQVSKFSLKLAPTLWVWDNWVSQKPTVWHMWRWPLCMFLLCPWHVAGLLLCYPIILWFPLSCVLWSSHSCVKWSWAICKNPFTAYRRSFEFAAWRSKDLKQSPVRDHCLPFIPLILSFLHIPCSAFLILRGLFFSCSLQILPIL